MRKFSLALISMLLVSCDMLETSTTAITVLADRTDPNIPTPSSSDIRLFCSLDADENSRVLLKFQNITNTDVNQGYVAEIEAYSVFDNALQRKSDIQNFYAKIDTLVSAENLKSHTYTSSSIVVPLIDELTALATIDVQERTLLLYSDISEFSDIFNVYDYESLVQLHNDPKAVARLFTSKVNVPTLDGISLYIIYYPKTTEQDRLFQSMVKVYRELFKDSGLHIHIGIDKKY